MSQITIIGAGRVGANPEKRFTTNGTPVTTFSVATNTSWTDQNGERQERTEWHRCVAWGKLADIAAQVLAKGTPVYLQGENRTRSYQVEGEAKPRYITEVRVNELRSLETKAQRQARSAQAEAATAEPPVPSQSEDDELPF